MSVIEIIAVLFSLLSVIYTVKKSIISWIYGLIGIIFYSILFYQSKLYSNFLLQILFMFQSIYGIWNWGNNKEDGTIKVELSTHKELAISIGLISIISLILIEFLKSSHIILDSITTSISIIAFYLLGKRKIENWIFWILADLIYIYMFFIQELYLSSGLYLVFLILCILGYKKWKNL